MLVLSCAVEAGKHISACWTRSNYLWAPANTFFCNTSVKLLYSQKGEISGLFIGRIIYDNTLLWLYFGFSSGFGLIAASKC